MITKPTYWTQGRVEVLLREIVDELLDEEKKPLRRQTFQIGELFVKRRIPPQYLSFWHKKYEDIEEICEPIYTMKQILELRINKAGLQNQLNSFMVIFNLKNNYGWKEESTVHDDAKEKANEAVDEIRNRLATRTKRNIRNKK